MGNVDTRGAGVDVGVSRSVGVDDSGGTDVGACGRCEDGRICIKEDVCGATTGILCCVSFSFEVCVTIGVLVRAVACVVVVEVAGTGTDSNRGTESVTLFFPTDDNSVCMSLGVAFFAVSSRLALFSM